MEIKLKSSQRFLIPLKSNTEYLLVKEIVFCGNNSNHNVPQIRYKGTRLLFDLECGECQKEYDYIVVMNESFDVGFSDDM